MITSPIMTTEKKAEEITTADVIRYIKRHRSEEAERLGRLRDYYDGKHIILSREKDNARSNNRIVTNHAAYISDFYSAYLMGAAVSYTSSEDIAPLTDMLKAAESAVQDMDLSLDCSVYGKAYDMFYMSDSEEPTPKLTRLSPLNAFVVYDDTVEQNPVFGVYYYPVYGEHKTVSKYMCSVQTAFYTQDFVLTDGFSEISCNEPVEHYFGVVPINEIYNNGKQQGDFEQVISLIDAYNLLQSDRVNDKEQFVDAVLLIIGNTLGDDTDEQNENYEALKRNKVLELIDGDAKWLTRQFDESSVEILKTSIQNDIHKISGVPDMTDRNFAGNSSGVAMKYKLLGLEQKTKAKERFFIEGLYYRLRAFENIRRIKGGTQINVGSIEIKLKRSLPENEVEIAQVAATLRDIIPQEDLLSLMPFIGDPKEAAEKMRKEKAGAAERQQKAFMNTPLGGDADENTAAK